MPLEICKTARQNRVKFCKEDFATAPDKGFCAAQNIWFYGYKLLAANGYLPSQVLAESANQRTDEYGGSISNKVRFVLEVMQELISAVCNNKVGIKPSPFHPYSNMVLDNPVGTYTYLVDELNKLNFTYVESMKRRPNFPSPAHYPGDDEIELFGRMIQQTVIANTGYDKVSAEAELEKGIAGLVSFSTLFLANPDLPKTI